MKRKFYAMIMRIAFKMIKRSDRQYKYWCRQYTEWAERYCKEGKQQ